MAKKAAKAKPKKIEPALSKLEEVFGYRVCDAKGLLAKLTPREEEVIALLAGGTKSKQIADSFGLSPKTLDIHRANIMRKFNTKNVVQVVGIFNLARLADAFPNLPATRDE